MRLAYPQPNDESKVGCLVNIPTSVHGPWCREKIPVLGDEYADEGDTDSQIIEIGDASYACHLVTVK